VRQVEHYQQGSIASFRILYWYSDGMSIEVRWDGEHALKVTDVCKILDFYCTTFPAHGSDSLNLALSRTYGGSSSPLTVIAEAMPVARRERVS
jgi:hypothetical protein